MPLAHTDMILRMATAVVLGGVIGYERGRSDHPAGLRTHILVALASATFMLISTQFIYFQHYVVGELVHVDPSRIASGVVMGIGFIGAGSILRTGTDVRGLTTAASLWLVTATGMAAGCGMFPEAIIATVAALFVLGVLRFTEAKRQDRIQRRVRVELEGTGTSPADIEALLLGPASHIDNVHIDRHLRMNRSRVAFDLFLENEAAIETMLRRIEDLPGVRRITVHSPAPRES